MSDNIIDLVEEAQKKGKFNLADAIKGRAFPSKSVDVYIDAASAYRLSEINEELKTVDPSDPRYQELQDYAEELGKAIVESKLTFHMRGVGQGVVERITREANQKYPTSEKSGDSPDWIKYYLCGLIAENIVKVTDADGNEDERKFTAEEIMDLRDIIPIDSWEVLIDAMQKLTLASSYFEAVTDAGFLPKS
jgi:hypothetical protein